MQLAPRARPAALGASRAGARGARRDGGLPRDPAPLRRARRRARGARRATTAGSANTALADARASRRDGAERRRRTGSSSTARLGAPAIGVARRGAREHARPPARRVRRGTLAIFLRDGRRAGAARPDLSGDASSGGCSASACRGPQLVHRVRGLPVLREHGRRRARDDPARRADGGPQVNRSSFMPAFALASAGAILRRPGDRRSAAKATRSPRVRPGSR